VQNTRVLGRQRRRFKVQMGAASGFTVDVSAGGFCAELMRVFPKGTAVKGTLLVDGQEYDFSGRVAWAKQGDFRLNMRGRMGVTFTDAPDELKRIFGVGPSGTPLPAPGPFPGNRG
jgi:PilZ domain-containing protein